MKKRMLGVLLFLCAVLLITSAWAEEGISGVWQGKDEKTGAILRLTLREDGSYEGFSTEGKEVYDGGYTAEGGVCSLTGPADQPWAEFKYLQSQGKLVLLTAKGEVFTFERQSGSLLDEMLLGTWGGLDNGMYGEITFLPTGEARVFIPYRDADAFVTTFETAGSKLILRDEAGKASILSYQVTDINLFIDYPDGKSVTMAKKDGVLKRFTPQNETILGAADPALCGTWGIYQDGVYREITFAGDGRYASFIPQDSDVKAEGQYIAWNGTIVILAEDGLHVDTYQVVDNELWYTPALHVKQVYTKKSGALDRVAE